YNRRAGNIRLTHDEWLYKAFEAIDAAEPREHWLRDALNDGPVRLVILEADDSGEPKIAGLSDPLNDLGFRAIGAWGRLGLWERRSAFAAPSAEPGEWRVATTEKAR